MLKLLDHLPIFAFIGVMGEEQAGWRSAGQKLVNEGWSFGEARAMGMEANMATLNKQKHILDIPQKIVN